MSYTLIDMRGQTNVAQATVSQPAPGTIPGYSAVSFTMQDVANPNKLVLLLKRMSDNMDALARALGQDPLLNVVEFRDLSVSLGVAVSLQHNLGRRARWFVVDDSSNAVAFVRSSSSTDSTLILTPDASGTVSVVVF